MIELLPVITIVAASIWLSIKAFDSLVETFVFIHDMHEFRLVFDDYEAELCREDINKDTAVELRSHLAKDLSEYCRLITAHPWKYRCWKLVAGESKLLEKV